MVVIKEEEVEAGKSSKGGKFERDDLQTPRVTSVGCAILLTRLALRDAM